MRSLLLPLIVYTLASAGWAVRDIVDEESDPALEAHE